MDAGALADDAATSFDAIVARDLLIAAAQRAGRIGLASFNPGGRTSARVQYKSGGSPVTAADLAVDDFLKAELAAAFPSASWFSEETEDDPARLSNDAVVIVDPIDGTRAFIDGDPRWAVSIALVVRGRPIAGVVHAPALDETYAAAARSGATLNSDALIVSARPTLAGARIGGPRAMVHALDRSAGLSLTLEPKIPSLAYRIALVARGGLDLAIASENAHDWDIAAADLILAEAGGMLVDARGEPLIYNQEETRRPALFAASKRLIGPFVAAAALAKAGQNPAVASGL
jgi:myo-inositol-1(or 4)-monophosphatase